MHLHCACAMSMCICLQLHHLVEKKKRKKKKERREGRTCTDEQTMSADHIHAKLGPEGCLDVGGRCSGCTFEPEGVEREQREGYIPVQLMQVEVGGVHGWMALASDEGRGEIRKIRKRKIWG